LQHHITDEDISQQFTRSHQQELVNEPSTLPAVATITSIVGDKPLNNKAPNTISELKGRIVAAKNADVKRPK